MRRSLIPLITLALAACPLLAAGQTSLPGALSPGAARAPDLVTPGGPVPQPATGRFDAAIVQAGSGVVTYRLDTATGEVDACTRAGCVSGDRFTPTPFATGAFKLIVAPDRVAVLDTTNGKLYTCDRVEPARDGKPVVTGGGLFNCT